MILAQMPDLNPLGYLVVIMVYVVVTILLQGYLESEFQLSKLKSTVLALCWPGPAAVLLWLLAFILDIIAVLARGR